MNDFYDQEDSDYLSRRRDIKLHHTRKAVVYKRQSSHEQRRKRRHSLEMQGDLKRIAIEDFGYAEENVLVIETDLGISGTLREENRPGLAELLGLIRNNQIEVVFVVKPDRLYRDQTLVGPIDFALECQKHDVYVIYLDYNGPAFIDFNNDNDFEDWVRMSQESAKELKNMQIRMGGAKFYKAQSGKYVGTNIHWGWKYDPKIDMLVIHPPHRQTILNILNVAVECTSLRQVLIRVKADPACWFTPFEGDDLVYSYKRHTCGRAKMSTTVPYVPGSIYQIQSILTCPLYIGIHTFGGGPGAQKKVNALKRKQTRGKVKSRIRLKPHFFGIVPELALLKTPEEEALFWAVQDKFNPKDLRYSLETSFKQERPNPNVIRHNVGRVKSGVKSPYTGLVFCGAHGFDDEGGFQLTHHMRALQATWTCGRDYSYGEKHTCTHIRQHVLNRILDTHIRLRLSGGDNSKLDEIIQLVEHDHEREKANLATLQKTSSNIQTAIQNYMAQLRELDVKTEVGSYLFKELQGRIAPLLVEKQGLERDMENIQQRLRHGLNNVSAITMRDGLKSVAEKWADVDTDIRHRLLHLLLENILVYTVPGTRTILIRFRWKDNSDDWCMSWYWGERNNEPWAEWEDEALRRLWSTEKSARAILAALKPGRKWRTVRPHARKLGLNAHLKRPDVEDLLREQDKETVPTDESPTLVYYFLGRFQRNERPDNGEALEVHEEKDKVWIGSNVGMKVSVSTLLFPSVPCAARIVISTPTRA